MLNNLLIYRVIIMNVFVLAFLAWTYFEGFLVTVFSTERTGIGWAMVVIFVIAMIAFARRVVKTSRAINQVKEGMYVDARKFAIKSSFVGQVAVWLVTLGLIGNIVGFSEAVMGLNISAGQDAAIASFHSMIHGMQVAFYTTLIGTFLGLWTAVNYHLLRVANLLLLIDSEALKR